MMLDRGCTFLAGNERHMQRVGVDTSEFFFFIHFVFSFIFPNHTTVCHPPLSVVYVQQTVNEWMDLPDLGIRGKHCSCKPNQPKHD